MRRGFGRMLKPWRTAFSAVTARRVAWSVVAVPAALSALVRRRSVGGALRALVSLPVAVLSTVLTVTTAYLVLINVFAYPFRPDLGLSSDSGDTSAGRYDDSWGGPTLAGAWTVHALLTLLLLVPAMALLIRALVGLQHRLTIPRALPAAAAAQRASAERVPAGRGSGGAARGGRVMRRVGVAVGVVAVFVALSLTSHFIGIGDNILWLPRDLASTIALVVTVSPLAGFALHALRAWRRPPSPAAR